MHKCIHLENKNLNKSFKMTQSIKQWNNFRKTFYKNSYQFFSYLRHEHWLNIRDVKRPMTWVGEVVGYKQLKERAIGFLKSHRSAILCIILVTMYRNVFYTVLWPRSLQRTYLDRLRSQEKKHEQLTCWFSNTSKLWTYRCVKNNIYIYIYI